MFNSQRGKEKERKTIARGFFFFFLRNYAKSWEPLRYLELYIYIYISLCHWVSKFNMQFYLLEVIFFRKRVWYTTERTKKHDISSYKWILFFNPLYTIIFILLYYFSYYDLIDLTYLGWVRDITLSFISVRFAY